MRFFLAVAVLFSVDSLAKESFTGVRRLSTASFVPGACPTAVTRANLVGTATTPRPLTSVYAAAKKKTAPVATKKIQVKMLKYVPGTGQKGDVVMVTPAFFNNKLRPTKSAEVISDEQVEQEQQQAAAEAQAREKKALELKERIEGVTLSLVRKAGPDGQLFGGIGPKVIMEELQASVKDEFLSEKSVKITAIVDGDGKKMRGDIKHIGTFGATIALIKDVSAKFPVQVEAEN